MSLTWERAGQFVQRRQRLGAAAGVAVWSIWAVGIALGGSTYAGGKLTVAWGNGTWDAMGQVVGMDHVAFYTPARLLRDGRGAEIYTTEPVTEFQGRLFPEPLFTGKYEAYRNPPFFAWLHTPLAAFTYTTSVWVAIALSLACLALAVWLLAPERKLVTLLWSLTFLPTFTVIGYGQTSLYSLAMFAGCYRLLAAGHRFWGGFAAGLLWFKPPLLTGLLAWWVLDIRRYWPALAGVTAAGAAWVLGTWPFLSEEWLAFARSLHGNVGFDSFDWWKAHNARAFWRLLLTPELAPLPALLWLASIALGVAWFAWASRPNRDSVPVAFTLSALLMLWASPHVMIYEWAAAIIPAILLWFHAPGERDRWRVLVAAMWLVMFVSTDFGRLQEYLWREFAAVWTPPILQPSVPALAWAMWAAGRGLRKS